MIQRKRLCTHFRKVYFKLRTDLDASIAMAAIVQVNLTSVNLISVERSAVRRQQVARPVSADLRPGRGQRREGPGVCELQLTC